MGRSARSCEFRSADKLHLPSVPSRPVDLRIGCVGYSYDFWVGPFYPKHTPQSGFLKLYGKVFDLVEIDSTFYVIPQPDTTKEWHGAVPPGFLFAAKFPRVITHELEFAPAGEFADRFFRAVDGLRPKVGPLVVQLPPSFTYSRGHGRLFAFLDELPDEYRYAVEFRHGSWMHGAVFQELRRRGIALVWNEVVYVDTVPEITADFVYLRFVGDRSLDELGWIQIDRTVEMRKWAARLRGAEEHVDRAYVLFNNHFAGFGPASANAFRDMLGLPGVDFAAVHTPDAGQMRLGDFG